jgi:uncharacterized membrane protein
MSILAAICVALGVIGFLFALIIWLFGRNDGLAGAAAFCGIIWLSLALTIVHFGGVKWHG